VQSYLNLSWGFANVVHNLKYLSSLVRGCLSEHPEQRGKLSHATRLTSKKPVLARCATCHPNAGLHAFAVWATQLFIGRNVTILL